MRLFLFVLPHSLSPPTVYCRERVISPRSTATTQTACAAFSPRLLVFSPTRFLTTTTRARAQLSLLLCFCLCIISRHSRVQHTGRGGVGGSGVGGLEAGSSESRAKYRHYSNQPWRYSPNRLHILLTPAELQPSDLQQKDKEARKLRALHHSCSVEGATFKFHLFQRQS